MRRAVVGFGAAVVLALGIVGLLPGPALAAGPVISWSSPADGATFAGPVTISGEARQGNSGCTDHVTLSLSSDRPIPSPTHEVNGGAQGPLGFNWAPPLPYNGIYTVQATATGRNWPCDFSGAQQSGSSRTFRVEAPPATPAGVKATVDQAKRAVTVSWAANQEPDLLGYTVLRKEGSGYKALKTLGAGEGTSYTDALGSLPAGTYQYQVYAARQNADGSGFVASPNPGTTSGKVTTPPPSPPTSSTTPSGGNGGSTRTGGTTNTTAGPGGSSSKTPTVATHGKVDLSGFAALLPSGGGRLPTVGSTPAPDGGFDEALPFQANGGGSSAASQDDDIAALGGQQLASSQGDGGHTSLLFLAAGLLVTVVLMHVLWLRGEVNRDALPAVAPQDPAEPHPV